MSLSFKHISTRFAGSVLVVTAAWTIPAEAAYPQFKALYVFGDSLSDKGNFLAVSSMGPNPSPFPPPAFYYEGRFSNGPVWTDYLANDLGLDVTSYATLLPNAPLPAQGINFAFGGASTGTQNLGNTSPPFPPGYDMGPFFGLTQEINAYTNLFNNTQPDPDALFTLWAGANDYLAASTLHPGLTPAELVGEVVGNLTGAITTLANSGAKNILVANLPDLGITPVAQSFGPDAVAGANALTYANNTLLAQSLAALSLQFPQTKITLFDVNTLVKDFIANPASYGLEDTTTNCTGFDFPMVSASNPADVAGYENCLNNDPSKFIFFDNQHPVTTIHRFFADTALETLSVPEPSSAAALGLLGLLLVGKSSLKNFSKSKSPKIKANR